MKIEVTQTDIESGADPIKNAVERQTNLKVIVDSRFMVVKGNEKFPRRLPLSAEVFQLDMALGRVVKPFSFEI